MDALRIQTIALFRDMKFSLQYQVGTLFCSRLFVFCFRSRICHERRTGIHRFARLSADSQISGDAINLLTER
jgi:hypothetical protein